MKGPSPLARRMHLISLPSRAKVVSPSGPSAAAGTGLLRAIDVRVRLLSDAYKSKVRSRGGRIRKVAFQTYRPGVSRFSVAISNGSVLSARDKRVWEPSKSTLGRPYARAISWRTRRVVIGAAVRGCYGVVILVTPSSLSSTRNGDTSNALV